MYICNAEDCAQCLQSSAIFLLRVFWAVERWEIAHIACGWNVVRLFCTNAWEGGLSLCVFHSLRFVGITNSYHTHSHTHIHVVDRFMLSPYCAEHTAECCWWMMDCCEAVIYVIYVYTLLHFCETPDDDDDSVHHFYNWLKSEL